MFSLLFIRSAHEPSPHSFPTRRSSDLEFIKNSVTNISSTVPEIKTYDHICMLSGGLDSYIGAIDLLEDKKKVLFLSFYGRGKDRKSTRLNSSHVKISYAVFCLKK